MVPAQETSPAVAAMVEQSIMNERDAEGMGKRREVDDVNARGHCGVLPCRR